MAARYFKCVAVMQDGVKVTFNQVTNVNGLCEHVKGLRSSYTGAAFAYLKIYELLNRKHKSGVLVSIWSVKNGFQRPKF